ncbi:MAG: hypothetical protein QOG16_1575 [Actinomycetota bacterium]|nr:hypothetical protein [Actinomycetota bacterium]
MSIQPMADIPHTFKGLIQIGSFHAFKRAAALAVAMITTGSMLFAAPARAALPSSDVFGPAIDNVGYDGQTRCSPKAKPGMVAFQRIVMANFPSTGSFGISRACNVGGTSEHKEGRAWDWAVNASFASDRAIVQDLFAWLLAQDRYGNEAAMAKRFGIMYVIWNKKIWGSWGGWSTYCVEKKRGCVDPDDGDLRNPHTDHVHFSMTRAGAQKQTTFWNQDRSMLAGIAAHPSYGYWEFGRNGGIVGYGTGWYGSKSDGFLPKPAVAMASTVSGYGYWLVTKRGRVFPFGDASAHGQLIGKQISVVDIETTPSGNGYWLLAKSGRVFPFGDATALGGAKETGSTYAGMASTPTGVGYWLFGTNGNVQAYGDANDLGGLADDGLTAPVIGGDNFGPSGYWLATADGRVAPFGDAPTLGQPDDVNAPIVGFASDPTGNGYWVMTEMGKLWSFGQAPALGTLGN